MTDSTMNERARRLLKQYLEHTTDHAVICIDPQENIMAWLGAAGELFGYGAEEVVGRPAKLIFTPEDLDKGFDRYELAVARQLSRSEDDRWHVRKDGVRIWITGSVAAIKDESGQLLGYVKVMRDKTDLRGHIESLENDARALKTANDRTHRFLSTLGHELRNPLSPMQTAAHIIQRLSTDPRVEKSVEVMVRQIGVLSRLAEDLMEVSRVGAGKLKLDLKKTDLRQLLSEASFAMQREAAAKGIRLECLMPDGSLDVALDVDRFERVVLNLLGNAIKYTDAGGTVWVKATQECSDILFRVEDTGRGIAPEVLPRIFDLFTQEHQSADMVPGGLGIGLTIVRELVELHDGTVQARSAGVGKGAEFTVRLPAMGGGS
ncbi:MAG: PAS domain-containing sensor histidine kinase [Ramlibacter sp.]